MTEQRKKLINRFQSWLDTDPRKQIIAAVCANIAEEYAEQQLLLHNVSQQSEQLIDFVKSLPTKKIMHFDEWLKFLKWEQIGNSYVYKQGNRYKDANELKQIHTAYLKN
jgi:hypothetical protein